MTTSVPNRWDQGLPGLLNALGLYAISLALIIAFYYQLVKLELPCPLCLLQRAGMMLIGLGFLFNLRFGLRSRHYAMALIGCVVTGVIATRQVLLHIKPGDAGYGSALLGLHFYTWALVASVLAILGIAVMMMLRRELVPPGAELRLSLFSKTAIGLFILLTAANLVSTVLECGGGQCADNPVRYELLH